MDGARRTQGTDRKLIPNHGRKGCREETAHRPTCKREDNINIDLTEIGCDSFD
jgi:hypothetical protein